jgi:phosphatidylserine/phosphatidylglycerophosphate/cardiolipin synthase-like enzyme
VPTLDELKSKWFIPMTGDVLGVPCRRADTGGGTQLNVSTDGNTVALFSDGQAYMSRWHTELGALHGQPGAEFMHAGWRLEGVKTLGNTSTANDALEDIDDADGAGVAAYPLACRNLLCVVINLASIDWLRLHGVWKACLDNRFPPGGSNHQKFAVFKRTGAALAILGSIDISKTRWDRPAHLPTDPDRDPTFGKPTHDTGAAITGPAVADVELTYRERWNDSTRTLGLDPPLPPQPLISTPLAAATPGPGTQSVQVLRTYGITNRAMGYSWSPTGEFTVWASYLNAIRRASTYIYIEDQYFLPWGWPPRYTRTGAARDVDVVYQLGEAMKRGVRVAILTPSNDEDSTHMFQKYQRDIGVNYLLGVKAAGAAGDIVVASLQNSGTDVYVHSKLMLVDDELVLIGSTNVGQRSMTYDGEIHAAVVDSAGVFARECRKTLWGEHTARPPASLDAPVVAYATFKADVAASAGHLKPYPVDAGSVYPGGATAPPTGHAFAIRNIVDPYAGPPGLA